MKRLTSRFILLLFLCSVLVSLPRINTVKASGTIYIRADGTVDPPTPSIERVGDMYTFTANISDEIVIARSNIIIDGSGYTLRGTGAKSGTGFSFYGVDNPLGIKNITIQNVNIINFQFGIYLDSSSNNTISRNTITSNVYGVGFFDSSFNVIYESTITNNSDYGIWLSSSSFNTVSRNNVSKNTKAGVQLSSSSFNTVSENNLTNNPFYSIVLSSSSSNTFSENTIVNNNQGFYLDPLSRSNNVIENTIANNTLDGLILFKSPYNTIVANTITNNTRGVVFQPDSNNNIVSANTIRKNIYGVYVYNSSGNVIYHNNFINNTQQVYLSLGYPNVWDDDYPSGGNYWSDYTGKDFYSGPYRNVTGRDGIGDTPHVIDADNKDNYPLMGTFSSFKAYPGYQVSVVCNSTIENFEFFKTNSTIRMRVTSSSSTQLFGFCRVVVPKSLMYPPYTVTIDGGLTEPLYFNGTLYDNSTHRWIYFAYPHSTHVVEIQGADIIPPVISILSPEDQTYAFKDVPLTFTVDEPTSWIGYSLDGQVNVTISGNTTLIGLSEGVHTVTVYANDTAGNTGSSNTVYFTIDTVAPRIQILSPENKTYTTSSVPLTFTVNELTPWIGYSLDGQKSVTITGNRTLSNLPNGLHNIIVYASDTAGNTGSSKKVYFTVKVPIIIDTTPPSISILSPENKSYATTDIQLTFTVNEAVSWTAYSLDNNANVTITGNTTLSGLSNGPHSLTVYAKDIAGNTGASEKIYFSVTIKQPGPRPEPFPTWILVTIVVIAVGGAALLVYFAKFKKAEKKVK